MRSKFSLLRSDSTLKKEIKRSAMAGVVVDKRRIDDLPDSISFNFRNTMRAGVGIKFREEEY